VAADVSGSPFGEDVDWDRFDGPADYRPESVPDALWAVARAGSESTGLHAYNSMLDAVGHNHSGGLYPAAEGAIDPLMAIALGQAEIETSTNWGQWAALEVLIDMLGGFGAVAHWDTDPAGGGMDARMHAKALSYVPLLKAMADSAGDSRVAEQVRVLVADSLEIE